MKVLDHKLLRELWQLRMQMLSIALVVAAGVMAIVTMRGSYDALVTAQLDYYEKSAFADVWASLKRAPVSLTQRISTIPGVHRLDTRVTFLATLDLPGLELPAQGRFVSLPVHGRPLLNDLRILQGRYIDSAAPDEVIISEKFAQARHLGPGAAVTAILNGRAQVLRVVGVASSPEHSYSVPPGSMLPDNERYGVFWMSRDLLGPVFNMDGAFNEVVLTLDKDANTKAVLTRLDALLEPWGGQGAYAREDQLSHLVLQNELAEMRIMGTFIPAIFLGVAMFLLHQVLNRLISTQRNEIAVLKAFGYTNLQIGWHYFGFALFAVVIGALLGWLGGIQLGQSLVGLYGQYFELPDLRYRFSPSLFTLAMSLALLGAGGGALTAVMHALRLPPAEAMRPPTPAVFRKGWLEVSGAAAMLSPALKYVLRNLQRRPLQFILSTTGIACALSILVTGMFMFDAVNYLVDTQFRKIQREDLALGFKENIGAGVHHELQRLPGVLLVETWRMSPVRLRNGHVQEETVVTGLDASSRMRRIVNSKAEPLPFPSAGLVLSKALADKLQVVPGEQLEVEWLDGKRLRGSLQVSGVSDDYLGLSAWMNKQALDIATGDKGHVSGAWLRTGTDDNAALYAMLKKMPAVAGVSSPARMLQSFEEEMTGGLLTASAFLLGFAGIIAFGVIYNSARIALAERARELASLRVMGFFKQETTGMLLGEQLLITLVALVPGCVLGYLMAYGLVMALENDSYRIPLVVNGQSYLLASCIILVAALLSMLAVRHRLNNMELVSVLKTRE
jgi:putative ABC transport system permease protein